MLFYLVVKYLCWLWSVVPDDAAITLFCIISFFETVFEVWLLVAMIGAFTPMSPEEHQRTLKELYESDLFKDKKEKK